MLLSRCLVSAWFFMHSCLSFLLKDFFIAGVLVAGVLSFLLSIIISSFVSIIVFLFLLLGLFVLSVSKGKRDNGGLHLRLSFSHWLYGLHLSLFLDWSFLFCLFFLSQFFFELTRVNFYFLKTFDYLFQERNLLFVFQESLGELLASQKFIH